MVKAKQEIILLAGILILGFFLRSHNLYTWPRLGATFDEYAWAWQGMNLIQKGVPISWSPHPQYKDARPIIYQKTHFRLVTPFLEHPPVFGLVSGGFALINGVKDMYGLTIQKIRPLAVILGVLSIFVIFLFVKEIYDKSTALIASLLYSTIPTVVIGSRIVQNENFFIPVWLLSLFLIIRFIKTKKSLFRNLSAILCGILILAKIPWVAGTVSIILIFLYLKKYADLFKFLLLVIPFFLFYIAYGFFYDANLFLSLWGLQLNRYDLSFASIFALFQKPYLVDRFYLDGWIYFGWFSFLLLLVKDFRKNYVLIFAMLSYFIVFLSAIPDEAGHGWYRYPFYPFLLISIALFIKKFFAKNFLLTFFFLVFVGTSLFDLTWEKTFGFSYPIFRLLILSWILVLFPLIFGNKLLKTGKVVSFFWLAIFILMNVWAINIYNEM